MVFSVFNTPVFLKFHAFVPFYFQDIVVDNNEYDTF